MIRFALAALLAVAAAIGCRRVVELSPLPDASQDVLVLPDTGVSGSSFDALDVEDSGVTAVFDGGLTGG